MSGKIKTSQEIKYIMGLLSWNINFESGDAAEILTVRLSPEAVTNLSVLGILLFMTKNTAILNRK